MGVILDSSVLIAGERRGETVRQMMDRVRAAVGDTESALSAMSILELTHGIYRAKAQAERERRRAFVEELVRDMIVHPVSSRFLSLPDALKASKRPRVIRLLSSTWASELRRYILVSMS